MTEMDLLLIEKNYMILIRSEHGVYRSVREGGIGVIQCF